MEHLVISAAIQDREAWQKVVDTGFDKNTLSPEGLILFDLVGSFYATDPEAPVVDTEVLHNSIERVVTNKKMRQQILDYVASLPAKPSIPNILRELREIKRHSVGLRLASKLTAGKYDPEVEKLVEEYSTISASLSAESNETDHEVMQGLSVVDLVARKFNDERLIKLLPKTLNDRVDGGASPGHHIILYAPPEMGKTLFSINMVAGFLWQKLPTLYIGNEDPPDDILMRLINRLTGMNKYEVKERPDVAQALAEKRNYGLFTIASLAPGNFRDIERLSRTYNPRVIVLDQLRNLDVKSENRTQALEKAATEARNLAKRFQTLVVSVTQAADSARGKRVLNIGDVDSSNVGIPGQADLMLGIGGDNEMVERNMRMVSLPKDKLSGNHTPFTVTIDPALSKVIDNDE